MIQVKQETYRSLCNSRIISPDGSPVYYVMAGEDIIYPEKYLPYKVVFQCEQNKIYGSRNNYYSYTYTIETAFPCYVRQYGGEELVRMNYNFSSELSRLNNLHDLWVVSPYCIDVLKRLYRPSKPYEKDFFFGMDTLRTITYNPTGERYLAAFTEGRIPYNYFYKRYDSLQRTAAVPTETPHVYMIIAAPDPILERIYPDEDVANISLTGLSDYSSFFCNVVLPDGAKAICFADKYIMKKNVVCPIPWLYNGELDISNSQEIYYEYRQSETTTLLYNNNPLYMSYDEWLEDVRDKSKFPRQPTIMLD